MTPPLDRWALRLSRERCQLRDTIRVALQINLTTGEVERMEWHRANDDGE
ncbi:hypothetical protein [Roseomonas chloroacetimidivorans]